MKKEILEYHPNGNIKHKIRYYPNGKTKYMMRCHQNGNKEYEQYFDQQGKYHRKQGLPDYQQWFENGITDFKNHYVHGDRYNICNPCFISFFKNGKIRFKTYGINDNSYSKLNWLNCIKEI